MKYRFVIILLFVAYISKAQQFPAAIPGKQGIFVWCGNSFAKGFEYHVYVKQAKGWAPLSKMKFPGSLSEFNAKVSEVRANYPFLKVPNEKELRRIWEKAIKVKLVDSISPYSANPMILEALGAGSMVTGIEPGKDYSFKVVKSYSPTKADTLKTIQNARFPGIKLRTHCKAYKVESLGNSVTVEFEMDDPAHMFDCEVYRSEYLRKNFKSVTTNKLYNKKNGKMYLSIADDGVVKGAGYSYFVIPFDQMGNTGPASDTINVYNVLPKQLSSTFLMYKATSLDKENAIKLAWRVSQIKDLVSIDIYRSESYETGYKKITSLKPTDTVYLDRTVNPVSAYFYTIRLNGEYQRTFPSPRIPAILKPNRPNLLPPQDLTVKCMGSKLVSLCWRRLENDTRGYYVYRAEGYKGEPRQISALIVSDKENVCYTDSLSGSDEIKTYTYSVADVNTSYAISSLSESVSLQITPTNLPVPTKVRTSLQNTKVLVFWDDMAKQYPYVVGYRVNRWVEYFSGKRIEATKTIAFVTSDKNYVDDSLVVENRKYYYTIQCLGVDSAYKGSISQEVGCFIYESLPPSPSNLKVFPQEKSLIVQWDEPLAEDIKAYRIYRAEKNAEPFEIATLHVGITQYIDIKVEKGKSYYYTIETENNKGKRSKKTDLVGITLSK